MRGLVLLVLQLGGTALLLLGIWLIASALFPHIRGWERWQTAKVYFSPGEQGRLEKRKVMRAQLRGLGVLVLGIAIKEVVPALRRFWFG